MQFRNDKIVYRRYAGLFFCVCVDSNDNELAYLEAIHLFVEVLGEWSSRQSFDQGNHKADRTDAFFQNVCELDLVFSFYKVSLSSILELTDRFMRFSTRYSSRARSRRRQNKSFSTASTISRSWSRADMCH